VLTRVAASARRVWLLALALLTFSLVAPGPASAAPGDFEFKVLRNSCTTSGGDFQHGEVLLKLRVTENGLSGANKFTLAAVAQHYRSSNDTWQTEYTWDAFKVTFPNDANSYYHTRWFAYDPNDKSKHQIVVVIKVWHNKTVLESKTIISRSC
jgi:hypothetical protein